VSNFARDLLVGPSSIRNDPVFDMRAVDHVALYQRVPALRRSRDFRLQLNSFRDYLSVCTGGQTLLSMINIPSHLSLDPHTYALQEFEGVKIGTSVCQLDFSLLIVGWGILRLPVRHSSATRVDFVRAFELGCLQTRARALLCQLIWGRCARV
jgi:hypothetical protein